MLKRYLETQIRTDMREKMVFISGPRQCGKTTLAKSFLKMQNGLYLTWDNLNDRKQILREELPTSSKLIVLDEIHKYKRWRSFLKGYYDKYEKQLCLIVTGSAKLDYYRKSGDALQGRYHHLRLYPFSYNEIKGSQGNFNDLLNLGGFPEPFLSGSETKARRWSSQHRERVVYEELTDLEHVRELNLLELLTLRLPELVGSPLSLNSLREDIPTSHQTISRYVDILERLYFIFRIYPFQSRRINAIKKEPKHYHFDWTVVEDAGARFENFIAFHLLKEVHFLNDSYGKNLALHYFRDVDLREVDFVVSDSNRPIMFVECKAGDKNVDKNLSYLKRKFPEVPAVQVVNLDNVDFINRDKVRVCSARVFCSERQV